MSDRPSTTAPAWRFRVTVKRQESERGLARVCQGPRGWDVRVNGHTVIRVRPSYRNFSRVVDGWYFYGASDDLGILHINTCGELGVPEESAKVRALAYVKEQLRLTGRIK